MKRNCPLCKGSQLDSAKTPYYSPPWYILQCNICGFVYLGTTPTYSDLDGDFEWIKASTEENAVRREKSRLIKKQVGTALRHVGRKLFGRKQAHKILQQVCPRGPVLDIGCSDGHQIENLKNGYTPYGIEISAAQAAEAAKKFKIKGGMVEHAPALEALSKFNDNFFVGVLMRSYLEHEFQPVEVLYEAQRILKPKGFALVKVPNFGCLNRKLIGRRWCGFRYPGHVNYFTADTLAKSALRAGFFKISYLPKFLSDNMWALLRKHEQNSAK